jgi:hypothetical protein
MRGISSVAEELSASIQCFTVHIEISILIKLWVRRPTDLFSISGRDKRFFSNEPRPIEPFLQGYGDRAMKLTSYLQLPS